MGDPSNCKFHFSEPEKLFFDFPLQTPLRAGSCNGRPCQLANLNKKTFQGLKSSFLIFPSRHQTVSFSGAFPAAQSAVAMGDPSNWQIRKNWGPEKLYFDFLLQTPAVSFSGAFPAAQSAVAMGDPSNWQIKKKTFQSLKSCIFIFPSKKLLGVGKALPPPHPRHMFEPAWPHKNRENS